MDYFNKITSITARMVEYYLLLCGNGQSYQNSFYPKKQDSIGHSNGHKGGG